MTHVLYTYGTLRTGSVPTVVIPGSMFSLGWFPGVILDGQGSITAERHEVSDLSSFDRYEGYYPDSEESSLYIRRPYLDGWVYEYNGQPSSDKLIPSGDWLLHTGEDRGGNCQMIQNYIHQGVAA